MSNSNFDSETTEKKLSAVCGLFCPACTLYIATHEDPERLRTLAEGFQVSEEEISCDGCHAENRGPYCKRCKMVACAEEKEIDFCVECDEYACQDLKDFQVAMPHRIELWNSQKRIAEVGYRRWYREMTELYSCPDCQTINSAYDLTCRNCGTDPSCRFVADHKQEILSYLSRSPSLRVKKQS